MHAGLTSSDVLDTCFNVQLVRAADLLIADIDALLRRAEEARLRAQADAHRRPQPRASTPSPPPSASSWRRPTPSLPAPGALVRRAPRSRPARSPARSAPSPTSIRASRPTSPRKLGLRARADLDPDDPARPARHVLRHARRHRLLAGAAGDRGAAPAAHARCWRPRNISRPGRRAPPPCRTSATPCCPRTSPAWRAWCAATACPPWRTWRSGTSATSRTPPSSA